MSPSSKRRASPSSSAPAPKASKAETPDPTPPAPTQPKLPQPKLLPEDRGHRHGNFWNYPSFNPAAARLGLLPPSFFTSLLPPPSSAKPFTYADLGCNEGELTVPFFQRLLAVLPPGRAHRALGLDIDPALAGRAAARSAELPEISFAAADVTDARLLSSRLSSLAPGRLSLVSLFSTTMWLHVHLGDEGFAGFLRGVAGRCELLLVEPQPKRAYRKINKRLGAMKRPAVDIGGLETLDDLEGEMDRTMGGEGFERVGGENEGKRTAWGRGIVLYRYKGDGWREREKP